MFLLSTLYLLVKVLFSYFVSLLVLKMWVNVVRGVGFLCMDVGTHLYASVCHCGFYFPQLSRFSVDANLHCVKFFLCILLRIVGFLLIETRMF